MGIKRKSKLRYTDFMKTKLLIFALLLASVVGLAQDTPYQPSCTQTLKLAPNAFVDTYTTKNSNASEAGTDEAALYWADCKSKQNEARLAKTPKLKAKIMAYYKSYTQFFSDESDLAYLAAGGGTMFPHGRARFQTVIEERISDLITLLSSKAGASKSASISARYNKAKAKLEARIKKVQIPVPFTEGSSKTEIADKQKYWLETARSYAKQYGDIRRNMGAGIDLASTSILEFLAAGIWAEEL